MFQTESFTNLLIEEPNRALKYLYDNLYNSLCNKTLSIVKDSNIAEDIVQEVIFDIWQKREDIQIRTSIDAYIYRSCRNKALNHLRAQKMNWEDDQQLFNFESTITNVDLTLEADELQERIQNAISELPEKCGIIFSLSRFEGMSYQEISDSLEISIKTVEGQMSKALKILREKFFHKN